MYANFKENREEKSLIIVSPPLFRLLVQEFEAFHIHPYDFQSAAVKKSDGIEVILRYGSSFDIEQKKFFSFRALEKQEPEISMFFKEAAESCRQSLIADYYKMMKP